MNSIMLMLQHYFKELSTVLDTEGSQHINVQEIYKDKRIIKIFLNICECIRANNEW